MTYQFLVSNIRYHYFKWCKEIDLHAVKESYYRNYRKEINIEFKLPITDNCKICDFLNIQIKSAMSKGELAESLKIKLNKDTK